MLLRYAIKLRYVIEVTLRCKNLHTLRHVKVPLRAIKKQLDIRDIGYSFGT